VVKDESTIALRFETRARCLKVLNSRANSWLKTH